MRVIALQTPMPIPVSRQDRPGETIKAQSASALPAVQTVVALPDHAGGGLPTDAPPHNSRVRSGVYAPDDPDRQAQPHERQATQPFPELRFADPLPDLPEMDLPARIAAYHTALGVLRGSDTG